ncbi:hypothetical protein AMAG_07013 [Allomyces macrogynus ATCC 38327]|uniref:Uncharacterized protein n=1 Tax=Allomyces macrogynus (strain ATCC 38327) TaxID=578462 RepID=A0A0L0SFW8_ALLM3|nr:hypothetical protein AMAG_07013 [Allomyces macrogynus ATCC 38327]|eukprot:KNE61270.1 hypothetical protein AMAG_07013 [Allomyces macrogynus ATCC 38327]
MSNPSLHAASALSPDSSQAAASVAEHGVKPCHAAGAPLRAAFAAPTVLQARAMVAVTTAAATFTGLYMTTAMEIEWQVLLSIFAGLGIMVAWNMLYQSWRECTSASTESDGPLATTQPMMPAMGPMTSKAALPHASNPAIVATSVITLASAQTSDLTPSTSALHKSPSWAAPTTHASNSGTAVNSRSLHTSAPGPLPGTNHFDPLLLPPVYSMSRTRSAGSPTASAAALAETAARIGSDRSVRPNSGISDFSGTAAPPPREYRI